jgi:hypothetical protein
MVRPETSAEFVNRIANSAAVRPFVDYTGKSEPLDFTPAVGYATQTGIVWLSNGNDALVAFPQTGDREYQAHLFFAETCRGRRALGVAQEMLDWLKPYADRVWGLIPLRNKAALWFASALGFQRVEETETEAEGPVLHVEMRYA